jgi:hypothetical protein
MNHCASRTRTGVFSPLETPQPSATFPAQVASSSRRVCPGEDLLSRDKGWGLIPVLRRPSWKRPLALGSNVLGEADAMWDVLLSGRLRQARPCRQSAPGPSRPVPVWFSLNRCLRGRTHSGTCV